MVPAWSSAPALQRPDNVEKRGSGQRNSSGMGRPLPFLLLGRIPNTGSADLSGQAPARPSAEHSLEGDDLGDRRDTGFLMSLAGQRFPPSAISTPFPGFLSHGLQAPWARMLWHRPLAVTNPASRQIPSIWCNKAKPCRTQALDSLLRVLRDFGNMSSPGRSCSCLKHWMRCRPQKPCAVASPGGFATGVGPGLSRSKACPCFKHYDLRKADEPPRRPCSPSFRSDPDQDAAEWMIFRSPISGSPVRLESTFASSSDHWVATAPRMKNPQTLAVARQLDQPAAGSSMLGQRGIGRIS